MDKVTYVFLTLMAKIRRIMSDIADIRKSSAAGAPTKVTKASEMTDTDKNYLYLGTESGYNSGHIYYFVEGVLTDGGAYGGVNVDDTLTISGQAADAKVTGDKIEEIKEDLSAFQTATTEDIGKALKAKTVTDGKVTEWEFGETGGEEFEEFIANSFYEITRKNEVDSSNYAVGFFVNDADDTTNTLNTGVYTPQLMPIIPNSIYLFGKARKIKLYKDGVFATTVSGLQSGYSLVKIGDYNGVKIDSYATVKDSRIICILSPETSLDGTYAEKFIYYKDNELPENYFRRFKNNEFLRFGALNGIAPFSWQVFENANLLKNVRINNDGELLSYNPTNMVALTTGFERVTAGETLYTNLIIYFYDSDKRFISSVNGSQNGGIVTVPETAVFARTTLTVNKETYESDPTANRLAVFRRGYGKDTLNAYSAPMDYNEVPTFKDADVLNAFQRHIGIYPFLNKKFVFIGDSYSSSGQWQRAMCNELLSVIVDNEAIAGGSFATYTGYRITAYEQVQAMAEKELDPDYICVFLGTNDVSNHVPVGEFVNSRNIEDFDGTTFIGGIQKCITSLQTLHPDAVIFLGYTPSGFCHNKSIVNKPEYLDALKSMALAYGIQYVDTLTCGLTFLTSVYDQYCNGTNGDGSHPYPAGSEKIGKAIARKLLHGYN